MHAYSRLPALLALLCGAAGLTAAQFTFPGQTLTVPDGFEVECVAGPPLVQRPMMADFDEAGRLYVADSSGSNEKPELQLQSRPHRIVRLEDTDGDGRFDQSVVFADRMMFPEGVLWYEGSVYTGAPPSIWKLEDTDGDGVADARSEWHQGKTLTGCANDLHGPYLGPDGWLYWCKGAFARQTYERPGRRGISDSAAHVFRARPDHRELDAVMSGGMDNPVEVAWSAEGELFFITTFFHHPEAGRRDAIVHCIYGGAYPKPHGVLDTVQQTGDLLPPLVELGPAAACSLMRYESQGLGPEYQDNLFSTLFNLRKVMRHGLKPHGSTYLSTNQDFLVSDNPDFHPTDVMEDADGSLLVIDTGGWYKICCPTSQLAKPDVLGAIYRVRRKGAPVVKDPRGLRIPWNKLRPDQLCQRLDDPRPAVRERALRTLARLGEPAVPALDHALHQGTKPETRRNAVWALTRIDGAGARAAIRQALGDPDPGVQRTALHSVALHHDAGALPQLLSLLQSSDAFLQRRAAEALGRLGDGRAVPALLQTVASFRACVPPEPQAVRIQEHALIFALIEIADAARTAEGLSSADPAVRRATLIALDQMDGGGLKPERVAPLLLSPDVMLKETATWIVDRHPEWGGPLAGFFAERLAAGELSKDERAELQRQLAQFARNPAIQDLLARTLSDQATPVPTRELALQAIARSGIKEVPPAWLPPLSAHLAAPEESLVRAAVGALRALPLSRTNSGSLATALRGIGADATRPVDLRLQALQASPTGLENVEPPLFSLLLKKLDPAEPVAERAAAAAVLARASLSAAQLVELAGAFSTAGPMELTRVLDAFENATTETVGLQFVASLRTAPALASVRADLLRARLAKFPPTVQEAGKELLKRLDVDPAEQAAKLDELSARLKTQAPDIRRGQLVFNSTRTACSACHAMGYLGGKVGPDLTSIGQIRTERDLLESVVFPSASFVRSYEPLIFSTRDGEEYSGIVRTETEGEIVLVTGVNAEQRIPRADVTGERPGTVSVMPQGLTEALSLQELADLMAFLKATTWGPR